MSLQLTVTHQGITLTNAYIKVAYVRHDNNNGNIHAEVSFRPSSSDPQHFEEHYVITPDLVGGTDGFGHNDVKQVYEYLKALDGTDPDLRDFTGATDI